MSTTATPPKKDTTVSLQAHKYQPDPTNPILNLVNKKVTIIERDRTQVTGTIKYYRSGLIKVTDAQVIVPGAESAGSKSVEWVLVDRTMIVHIYPA